jgi:small nuclear ribonucleoprotein D3
MSAPSKLTIPLTLLREAIGHTVQVELDTKDAYKGILTHADAKMNCTLAKVAHTAAEGRVVKVEEVFLKGSAIRMFVLPPALSQAPILRQAQLKQQQQQANDQSQQQQQHGNKRTTATSSSNNTTTTTHRPTKRQRV